MTDSKIITSLFCFPTFVSLPFTFITETRFFILHWIVKQHKWGFKFIALTLWQQSSDVCHGLLTHKHAHHLFSWLIFLLDGSREGDRDGRGREHAADAICPPLCLCAPNSYTTHMADLTCLDITEFSPISFSKKVAVNFSNKIYNNLISKLY